MGGDEPSTWGLAENFFGPQPEVRPTPKLRVGVFWGKSKLRVGSICGVLGKFPTDPQVDGSSPPPINPQVEAKIKGFLDKTHLRFLATLSHSYNRSYYNYPLLRHATQRASRKKLFLKFSEKLSEKFFEKGFCEKILIINLLINAFFETHSYTFSWISVRIRPKKLKKWENFQILKLKSAICKLILRWYRQI